MGTTAASSRQSAVSRCRPARARRTAWLEIMRRWRCRGIRKPGPSRWCVRIVGGRGLRWWPAGGGLGGRCTVVLARRPSSPI